jgi:hypothetical protein
MFLAAWGIVAWPQLVDRAGCRAASDARVKPEHDERGDERDVRGDEHDVRGDERDGKWTS